MQSELGHQHFRQRRGLIFIIVLIGFLLYARSLVSPLMVIEQFYIFSDSITFVGVLRSLYLEGEWLLYAVVAIATLILPIVKFGLMAYQCLRPGNSSNSSRSGKWLVHLGRWSMLDVFIIAILIVVLKVSFLSDARTGYGLYLFVGSILFATLAGFLLSQSEDRNG